MVSPRLIAKIESEEPTLRLAVLIDADNAQAAVIEGILAEVARFGEATVKRIYGDFTSPHSSSWKKVLQKYAIKPVQQFAYTTGKNSTDSTCVFQPSWTVIPREAGHAFQSKLDSRRVATRGCWGFTRVMSLGSSCRASA